MTGLEKIAAAFEAAQAEGRAALMPYLTAGYPDRDRFLQDARQLLEGSDLLEIGLPHSDPLGDGPVIQASSQQALENGMTVRELFSQVRELASGGKPVLVMTYYNPVYCWPGGPQAFLEELAGAGGAGLILPDLPPEEADEVRETAARLGLATVFLIAPTSTPERLRTVTEASSGFVYCVSVTGVTGARSTVAADVPRMLEEARSVTDLPLALGFGVSDRQTAREAAGHADGVIVGSAFISLQAEGKDLGGLLEELREGVSRS